MRPTIVPVAIIVIGSLFLPACEEKAKLKEDRGQFVVAGGLPMARLATVQAVSSKSPVRVPFALTNPTETELTYAVDGEGGLYHLGVSLYRDGELVKKGRVMRDEAAFQQHQVRRLKPKEAVIIRCTLPYVEVEPGKYELRLKYEIYPKSVDETKHGLTPMKLEQTILLDVRDE